MVAKIKNGTLALVNPLNHHKMNWISIADRMPNNLTAVLISDGEVTQLGFHNDLGWQTFGFLTLHNTKHVNHTAITHWQPLPEPPKN